MRVSLISASLSLVLAAGTSGAVAKAPAPSPCPEDRHAISLAVAFLESMDMAPTVVPCPRRVDDVRLARLFFEGVGDGSEEEAVAALYIRLTGEIFIDAAMNFRDPVDLSFFVHELVHSHQMESSETTLCMGVLEAEAYAIQAAFLRDQGLPREALLFDLMGQLQAGCASRY